MFYMSVAKNVARKISIQMALFSRRRLRKLNTNYKRAILMVSLLQMHGLTSGRTSGKQVTQKEATKTTRIDERLFIRQHLKYGRVKCFLSP